MLPSPDPSDLILDTGAVADLPVQYTYAERDTCALPPLNDADLILPAGTTYACDHYTWTVTHMRDWQGQTLPRWTVVAPVATAPAVT